MNNFKEYIARRRRIARRKNKNTIFDNIIFILKILIDLAIGIIIFLLAMKFFIGLANYLY